MVARNREGELVVPGHASGVVAEPQERGEVAIDRRAVAAEAPAPPYRSDLAERVAGAPRDQVAGLVASAVADAVAVAARVAWTADGPAALVDLRHADLRDVDLRGLDLTQGTAGAPCKLGIADGLPPSTAAGVGALAPGMSIALLDGADLRGAVLSGARMPGVSMRGARLSGAMLIGSDLRGANLKCASLRRAHLSGADLSAADLSHSDLRGAAMLTADLSGAMLCGTDLRDALLDSASLPGARLCDADLRWARLVAADLRDTALHGACFEGATLARADLRGAELSPTTSLSFAFLSGALLDGVPVGPAHVGRGIGERVTDPCAAYSVYCRLALRPGRDGGEADAAWFAGQAAAVAMQLLRGRRPVALPFDARRRLAS